MALSKWFPKLNSVTSLRQATQIVVKARAAAVQHYLRRVRSRPGKDPEDVHQLRVASRRLAAALSIFKSCLRPDHYRQLRLAARRIRRAAGALRDLHVQQALLHPLFEPRRSREAMAVDPFLRIMTRRSNLLESALSRVARQWHGRFRRVVAATIQGMCPNGQHAAVPAGTLGAAALKVLPRRLKKVLGAGGRDLNDLDNLHQLRIAAKRLRYAMEVFAYCLPAEFRRELYGRVEAVQEALGTINDLRYLCEILRQECLASSRSKPATSSPFRHALAVTRRQLLERQRSFVARWTGLGQGELIDRLRRILAAPRRSAGRKRCTPSSNN